MKVAVAKVNRCVGRQRGGMCFQTTEHISMLLPYMVNCYQTLTDSTSHCFIFFLFLQHFFHQHDAPVLQNRCLCCYLFVYFFTPHCQEFLATSKTNSYLGTSSPPASAAKQPPTAPPLAPPPHPLLSPTAPPPPLGNSLQGHVSVSSRLLQTHKHTTSCC